MAALISERVDAPDVPYLRLKLANGRMQVHSMDGTLLLDDCHAAVVLSDGTRFTTEELQDTSESAGPRLRWSVEMAEDGRAVRLSLEVENTTDMPLPIERFDVLVAPSGFVHAPLAELEVAQTGWQSWSLAHPPAPLARQRVASPPPVIGPMLPEGEAGTTTVPWMTLLHAPGPHSLLAGFVSARDQQSIVSIGAGHGYGHTVVASSYLEGIDVQPGEVVRSESLLLVFDQEDALLLERYARTLAAEMDARKWPHVPTGWCSWYYFFTEVSEADVLRNLEYLSAEHHRMPMEYVQLDDGYQAHIGDWLTLNEKFPSGMPFLTEAIRTHGYKPGLWLAPFLVSEKSAVYTQHPDWVLRDDSGRPINAIHNWGTENYALDVTNPEVASWLRHVVTTMVEEWGYDYLKIDFIYAGALRGIRYDMSATSVQAYRRGLEIIREAAGDRFILGCGAPFAPSVGMVDAMRVGPDVSPDWSVPGDIHGSVPAMNNAVRSTLAHTWMHGHLWLNDPDCLLVRERNSTLTLAEVQAWTSIVGMSGGMALVSDDLSRLEPDRAALIPLVLPPLAESRVPSREAVPFGPCVDGTPTRMKLKVKRDWEEWLVATMFNWSDEAQSMLFDPAEWGLESGTRYHLFDLWSGEHAGPCSDPVMLGPVGVHGACQLTVHSDLGRPQLVGATLHLLGGAVEVAGESWADDRLVIALDCPGLHEGALVVHVPDGYEYNPSAGMESEVTQEGHLLTVPVRLAGRATISLGFALSPASDSKAA